jgi:hypothetical protein
MTRNALARLIQTDPIEESFFPSRDERLCLIREVGFCEFAGPLIVRELMSTDPMFPEFVNLAVSNKKGATNLVAPFSLLI